MPPVSDPPFRALFDTHVDFVWRVLWRHKVAEREIEDACQEVFLIVHTGLPEFEGRSHVRSWIYGIARRVALGFRRKAYRVREQLPGELPEPSCRADQLELAERQQTLSKLEQALTRLPEGKREVFALYELEGMTMAEVARTLELPENTALSRLYAAREELRSMLSHERRAVAAPVLSRRGVMP